MTMTTRKNTGIRKAQQVWKRMTSRQHALAQPEGRDRAKPGNTGRGRYFHIEVRPKREFVTFRTQDVCEPGGIQRVAGKRQSGSWDDQKWLISKEQAHLEGEKLVPDTREAKDILKRLGSGLEHLKGDRFKAKPRSNVPEFEKPTPAQKRARKENIKKAQVARSHAR